MPDHTLKITLEVSGDNEATESPWWMILDPQQMMRLDVAHLAGMVTGPFFSRKEAEDYLKATRYNFSKRAVVWCASGYHSWQYKNALRVAAGDARAMQQPTDGMLCSCGFSGKHDRGTSCTWVTSK